MCTKCKAELTELRTFYDNGAAYCWPCYDQTIQDEHNAIQDRQDEIDKLEKFIEEAEWEIIDIERDRAQHEKALDKLKR